jgi:EmrB/QacA subfamily drug resistance transporter
MPAQAVVENSLLTTRRGRLVLALACGAWFLDVVDMNITNIAMPSIRHELHFSVQNLQWLRSAYALTYGGFLLLGGRGADLIGRRSMFVAGTAGFGLSSLIGGAAGSQTMLVAARLAQGAGAAMMTPAALSILMTTFRDGGDRTKAIGAWSVTAPIAASLGVVLGGVLSQGPGWRWVFFVNLPVCLVLLVGVFGTLGREPRRARFRDIDCLGAVLVTGAMLVLIFALVRAPVGGWGSTSTILGLAGALALFVAFIANERHHPTPLFPVSILRIPGIAAADAVEVLAMAGSLGFVFFLTLYMQNVLDWSPIETGLAFLPSPACVVVTSGISTQLLPRLGARPLIVIGTALGAIGVFWLAQAPVRGSYASDVLPGLAVMSCGLGPIFVGIQAAANAGVPEHQAGLAAALVTSSFQLGGAIGLAIFSAIATSRTHHLLTEQAPLSQALTSGFHRAFIACCGFLVLGSIVATHTANTRGEPARTPEPARATESAG